jgi:hypothetical protein
VKINEGVAKNRVASKEQSGAKLTVFSRAAGRAMKHVLLFSSTALYLFEIKKKGRCNDVRNPGAPGKESADRVTQRTTALFHVII